VAAVRAGAPTGPYHVAIEDNFLRENWFEIDALCKLNSLPFNATGETIRDDGTWRVYEFTWQMDAILFPLQGTLAARIGVPLSRTAGRPAGIETPLELAEIQRARHAVRHDAMSGWSIMHAQMLLFASSVSICQRPPGRPCVTGGATPEIDSIRMIPLVGEAGLTVAIAPRCSLGHRHGASLQRTSNNRVRSRDRWAD
jgi:hypothetical protein